MIIYQALTRLYKKGKFSDFDKKTFDYLKSLSVTHLWLTGVIRHSTNALYVKGNAGSPYSIIDYYDLNPYLADEAENRLKEFQILIKRAHKNGIKIIIDFVPNHVSPDYKDDFGGIKTLHYHDYDWSDTDKIDYSESSRENWPKLLNIIKYWAAMGVDGFRCDMVELVPREFLSYLISGAKAEYPELLFIAEAYDFNAYSAYVDCGFDLLYDKSGLYDRLREIICHKQSASLITANWQALGSLQGRMLNFLENHDEQRLASPHFAGSAQNSYAALAVSTLFYPTAFMLYFGQEIGENAFDGAEGRTSIFDFARCINPMGRLNAEQLSVKERYEQLLAIKQELGDAPNFDLCYCQSHHATSEFQPSPSLLHSSDELAEQSEKVVPFNKDLHFAFLRGKNTLIVCNFSDEDATINIVIPKEACSLLPEIVTVSVRSKDYTIVKE